MSESRKFYQLTDILYQSCTSILTCNNKIVAKVATFTRSLCYTYSMFSENEKQPHCNNHHLGKEDVSTSLNARFLK